MIDLELRPEIRDRNIQRCRDRGILLPTFRQMREPHLAPQTIQDRLTKTGLWDIDPANLFRITWRNEATDSGGGFGQVNAVWFPPELTGVKARIVGLVGKWFPTGAHKVGATYGCLAPALASGAFDATKQKAVWPSTGNYCRGGAYNSALLGCESIAILPEEMSQERFDWLAGIAGEVIATPGSESNVKEIFDACHDLTRERGDDIRIFNQFEEFGNYLWHYWVTGNAIESVLEEAAGSPGEIKAYVSATGSGGTIAAGDYLKTIFPGVKIAAAEALQCPTLLQNGFGAHRIEGIGDKHVPWIHNVKNTDAVVGVDDSDCMNLVRLFNEPTGRDLLATMGVPETMVNDLPLLGISGIGNLLASIKLARYFEFDEGDIVVTVLTDSMDLYGSRLIEMREQFGDFSREQAAAVRAQSLVGQRIDNVMELSYYDKKRIHNLKYFTWVEQQGRSMDELNDQWYEDDYWRGVSELAARIDEGIEAFNREVTGEAVS